MEIAGLFIPSFAIAAAMACLLAAGLGYGIVRSWRHRSFAEEPNYTVEVGLLLAYACLYSALSVIAVYILAGGLLAYDLMDQFVTLLFSAGTISLTALLLSMLGGGHNLTRDQARDAFVLLALPASLGLLLMGFELFLALLGIPAV